MTRCLKAGGIAVHTTEFNVSSNSATIDNDPTFVIFRQRNIQQMVADLRSKGRTVELDLALGDGPADAHVDRYPYEENTHLKLQLGSFVATSFGLIAGPVGSHSPAAIAQGASAARSRCGVGSPFANAASGPQKCVAAAPRLFTQRTR